MDLKQIQNWTKEAWKKSKKKADKQTEMLFLIEEVGEVAAAVRAMNGFKEATPDLEKELGDVILSVASIANSYDIDLNNAFQRTMYSIEQRKYRSYGGKNG